MARTIRRALVAGAVVAAVAAPAAEAGRPGEWTRLSDPATGANIDWSALARTPDGALHVAWKRASTVDPSRHDLMHSAIRANGRVIGTATPIIPDWPAIGRSALLADAAGNLRVLFGGQAPAPTNQSMSTAVSADGGLTWALDPADVVPGAALGNEGPTAAVTDGAGTVWSVFGAVRVQPGLVARDLSLIPSLEANQGGYGNLAAAAGGQVWVSWFSPGSSAADRGTFFQGIDPATGAPIGEKQLVPGGDGAKASPPRQPVAMTALQGGETSVLVAYPDSRSGLVHVVDITNPDMHGLIPGSRGATNIVLTADSKGRAWVVWETPKNGIAALRFNKGATDIGATVQVRPPARTRDVWTVSANAQDGRLDIVSQLNVNRGAGDANTGTGAWHTQVLPGLTMTVSTTRVRRATGGTVRFRVLDAGAPVRGARIRVSGRTLTTNAAGRASVRIPAGSRAGLRGATASKSGYTNSPTIGIRVVR